MPMLLDSTMQLKPTVQNQSSCKTRWALSNLLVPRGGLVDGQQHGAAVVGQHHAIEAKRPKPKQLQNRVSVVSPLGAKGGLVDGQQHGAAVVGQHHAVEPTVHSAHVLGRELRKLVEAGESQDVPARKPAAQSEYNHAQISSTTSARHMKMPAFSKTEIPRDQERPRCRPRC